MRTPDTRSRRARHAVLTACLLAMPTWAAALSLDEALQLAEQQAPSLAAQLHGIDAARSAAIPAGELPDPKLLLGLQNVPAEGSDRGSLTRDFMTMQMVGVMQEVPNRAKRQARVEVAQAGIQRAGAEQRVERLRVRRETALAWISAVAVEQKLGLFPSLYAENQLLAKAVQARIAGGRGASADSVVPKQEAALLAEQEDQLISLRTRQRAALRRWIGDAAAQPLSGALPDWKVDASHYQGQLQQHPELSAFAPMTEQASARVREAQADKRPDWSWELAYQRRGPAFGDMVSVQFSVDLPLFADSRQNPRVAARHAELNRVQAEREALEREHAAQLAEDLAEYQRLDRAVQRSQDSLLPLAEEKLALILAGYRAASAELSEVVAARRELIEARLRHIDLEEQRALSNARLYFAYGDAR
ncbi:TolC family protein [Pseudomonas benzenivorans]|uniref:TolC family protein n=1 Tax=Pseudomonas benzenivorans TaxID=556533 RepID=A0ABY5H609_9PSED|nr:TolC family protein [Pseudomonas benzenivorans]UTW07538.1 TolC family protein [Pseudomonas benzenivorans]